MPKECILSKHNKAKSKRLNREEEIVKHNV